ncbi:MAG: DUF4149 domain-containing protein [Candidatus Limnocylindria bacterium]
MDSLYFDLLQFGYHVGLALLVGGAIALGAAAAPALFGTAPSRGEAGTLFGAVLARWDGLAILAVVLVGLTSILKALAFEVPEPRLYIRWGALALLGAASLYSAAWLNPVARSIRSQTPAFDDLPADSPLRREFARLHAGSRRAMSLAVVFGLVALFFS